MIPSCQSPAVINADLDTSGERHRERRPSLRNKQQNERSTCSWDTPRCPLGAAWDGNSSAETNNNKEELNCPVSSVMAPLLINNLYEILVLADCKCACVLKPLNYNVKWGHQSTKPQNENCNKRSALV